MKAIHAFVFSGILVLSCAMPARAADGRKTYSAKCASCHGADGKGRTPQGKKIHVKNLAASKLDDAGIERQIMNGNKDAKGNLRMPSFKMALTSAEIKALVQYVKTLRE